MNRQDVVKHFSRLLTRWPKDLLRPENQQFQRLLQSRVQKAPSPPRDDKAEVTAAYLLLDNAIQKRFPATKTTMEPASNPMLYKNLLKELDEIPSRTWFTSFVNRLKHAVRWQ